MFQDSTSNRYTKWVRYLKYKPERVDLQISRFSYITPPQRISHPPLFFVQRGLGGLRHHFVAQNFEICMFPLFFDLFTNKQIKTVHRSQKNIFFHHFFYRVMPILPEKSDVQRSGGRRGSISVGIALIRNQNCWITYLWLREFCFNTGG